MAFSLGQIAVSDNGLKTARLMIADEPSVALLDKLLWCFQNQNAEREFANEQLGTAFDCR